MARKQAPRIKTPNPPMPMKPAMPTKMEPMHKMPNGASMPDSMMPGMKPTKKGKKY